MDITEGHIIPPNCCNSQNTENETDDSASHDSHDRLHDVSKSECETVETDESNSEDVGGTLANRIEDEKKLFCKREFIGSTRCLAVSCCKDCGHR